LFAIPVFLSAAPGIIPGMGYSEHLQASTETVPIRYAFLLTYKGIRKCKAVFLYFLFF
jgi:hypothetical protein